VIVPTKGIAATLLSPVLEPLGRCFAPASAKEILGLRADEAAQQRFEELSEKSQLGALTPDERAEYRILVEVGDLVALLQAKARRYLAEHTTP
jgi:hypothetical protein